MPACTGPIATCRNSTSAADSVRPGDQRGIAPPTSSGDSGDCDLSSARKHGLLAIDEVIREALLFLRHEVQSHGLMVTHYSNPAAPKVLGDRTQLQQVFVNLTVNAIQAMAQMATTRRTLAIRTTLSDPGTLCCTLEDSGPGIEPEHLDRLFDGFFTTKDAGMGLGLAISRSIIEAHGGYIRADNESAYGGARFSFTLPAKVLSLSQTPSG